MLSRKKIIAIIAFIFMSLIMFTFANPGNTDTAPVINVDPLLVKIVLGTDYDVMTGVTVKDDNDTLTADADITDTKALAVGDHVITYSVTDTSNNTDTAERTIRVLTLSGDEDLDGYTNKEEVVALTNFDDINDRPTYAREATITLSVGNVYTMEVFGVEPTFTASATDVADGVLPVVITNNINPNIVGTYTVTFRATDSLGNVRTILRPFTVVDSAIPVITLTGDATINIVKGLTTYTDQGAVVTDNYDTGLLASVVLLGDPLVVGSYTLTYNAIDLSGNNALPVVRTINVLDPKADLDGDKYTNGEEVLAETDFNNAESHPEYNYAPTIEEDNFSHMEINTTIPTFTATATDVADGDVIVNIEHDINSHVLGEYTITFTATDSLGNVTILEKDFHVVDTTAPIVTLNGGDMNVEINTTFTDPGFTITDNSGEVLPLILNVYYSPTGADGTWVGALGNEVRTNVLGHYAVWYGAEDSSHNEAYAMRRYVTVVDTKKPIVTLNGGDMNVEINTIFTDPGVIVTDNSGEVLTANLTVYYSPTGADSTWVGALGNEVRTNILGHYAVWYGAEDSSHNVADSVRRYVTIVDTKKPVVTLIGGNMTVEINTIFTDPGVIITDNSGEVLTSNLTVYYSPTGADGTWVGALGNEVRTNVLGQYNVWYGAEDSSHNVADSVRRTVTISDTKKPIINLVGGNMTVEVNTTFTDPGVIITDNSGEVLTANLTVYYSPTGADGTWVGALGNEVRTNVLGQYNVWYGAEDSSHNVADSVRRTVTVSDTTKPIITKKVASDVYYEVGSILPSIADLVIAIDNYDGNITDHVYILANPNMNRIGTYLVEFYVLDSSGNRGYTPLRVHVIDTKKPVVTLIGGNMTVEINTIFTDPGVIITDNSGEVLTANLTVYYSPTGADGTWVGALGNEVRTNVLGQYNVWYGAEDSSHNVADSVRRTVTISDTKKPIINLVGGNMTVEVNTTFTDPGVIITDNSGEVLTANLTVYYSPTGADGTWVGALGNEVRTNVLGQYNVWYGAEDSSHNVADSVRRTVTVVDLIKPVITLIGGNIELVIGQTFTDPGFTVSDNYALLTNADVVVNSDVNINAEGTYHVTYTVSDGFNTTTVTRTVVVGPLITELSVSDPSGPTAYNGFVIEFNRDFIVNNGNQITISYEYSVDGGNYLAANFTKNLSTYPAMLQIGSTKILTKTIKFWGMSFDVFNPGTIPNDGDVSMQENSANTRLPEIYSQVQAGKQVKVRTVIKFILENGAVVTYKLTPVQYN